MRERSKEAECREEVMKSKKRVLFERKKLGSRLQGRSHEERGESVV